MTEKILGRTLAALKEYDADRERRDALFINATTNEDVKAATSEEEAAAHKVRLAFLEDTKDVNTLSKVLCIHPDDPWLRRSVAAWGDKDK